MEHTSVEVKGSLGFSFWSTLFLVLSMMSVLQLASAQSVFSILVERESGLLRDARAVSVAPDGSIYIADTGHHRILQLTPGGDLLGEIGGLGSEHGQFQWPIDVTAQQGTSIWVSDFGNRRVEKFTRRFTWQGSIELPSDGGDIAGQPGALAVTAAGDLFVVDQDGQRILKYNPLGLLQTEIGARKGKGWVSTIENLAARSDFGVVWANLEENLVHHTDIFGSTLGDIGRSQLQNPRLVTFSDKTLWVCDSAGIKQADIERGEFRLVLGIQTLQAEGIQQVSDFACRGDSLLYLLDGRRGQLWKISLPLK